MKKVLLFFVSVIMLGACENMQDTKIQAEIPINKANQPDSNKGQIPSDNPATMMAIENEKYTWKDLDQYYRTDMQKEKDQGYFKNLKNSTFGHLVNIFKIAEQAPDNVIAYYVEEQSAMPYTPYSNEFVTCLKALKGYWTDAKINEMAKQRYENTQYYYANNSIWKSKWAVEKSKYEILLGDIN